MTTRILVNGAYGNMGTIACEALGNQDEFLLVGKLGKTDDLAQAIKDTKADIVIELTRADCVYANSTTIIKQGARPVIGASGLMPEQVAALTHLCEQHQIGGIIAPNFSLGAVLMMKLAKQAAAYLPDVEIIELHHQNKLDAPSGTALKTAQLIEQARTPPKTQPPLKELVAGARGALYSDINIHSLRLPGVLAQQQVLFGNEGETLSITHNSINRNCFKPGIILACHQVMTLNTLIYGLEHLI